MLSSDLYDKDQTIVAISTPPGVGGIAVIRVSGTNAIPTVERVWKGFPLSKAESHTVHYGILLDGSGNNLDECVAVVYKAPKSYTTQDTVEISVHGSRYVQQEALDSIIGAGARLALPGEFTRRAFVNGRLSLTQAEAVADIISSQSRSAHQLAMKQLKGSFQKKIDSLREKLLNLLSLMELELDFSEEDVEFVSRNELREQLLEIKNHIVNLHSSFEIGNSIKNGIPVAIVGPTNAGKSSLLNALLTYDRSIVSHIEGTTRDTVEETVVIGDYQYRFIDTAGLRTTTDPIEKIGIQRSHDAIRKANIILSVIDALSPEYGVENAAAIEQSRTPQVHHILVINKTDISDPSKAMTDIAKSALLSKLPVIAISAKNETGIEPLRGELKKLMETEVYNCEALDTIVTNKRHVEALRKALEAVDDAMTALADGLPTDLVTIELHRVIDELASITGQITTNDILGNIFSRFCIGK